MRKEIRDKKMVTCNNQPLSTNNTKEEKGAIHPIIFTSKENNCYAKQLFDYPMELFAKTNINNLNAMSNNMRELFPEDLGQFDRFNRDIIIINLINYIKQEAYASFYGLLFNSSIINYKCIKSNTEEILSSVERELSSNGLIYNIIYNYIHNSCADYSVFRDTPEEIDRTKNVIEHLSVMILNIVASCLYIGTDKALNKIFMSDVDVSDIMSILTINIDNPIVNILALLKSMMREDLDYMIHFSIFPGIEKLLLSNLPKTIYYIYGDIAEDARMSATKNKE